MFNKCEFSFIIVTCDLADSQVIPSPTLRVPGRPLDAVGSPCFKAIKSHRGVCGVEFVAGAGALPDNAERIEDGVPHWGPVHKDGAVVRGGRVQPGRHYHCRQMHKEVL